jgi:predicted transcriptional regulator
MKKSKLEMCESILEVLVKKALTIDEIAYDANMGCTIVKHYLDFLIENGLAEGRSQKDKTIYAITERGATVYKILNFQKYLEKLSKSLRAMDDASQIIPIISKHVDEQKGDIEK